MGGFLNPSLEDNNNPKPRYADQVEVSEVIVLRKERKYRTEGAYIV